MNYEKYNYQYKKGKFRTETKVPNHILLGKIDENCNIISTYFSWNQQRKKFEMTINLKFIFHKSY